MRRPRIRLRWSERRQVGVLLVLALGVVVCGWLMMLRPLRARSTALARSTAEAAAQLAPYETATGEIAVRSEVAAEQAHRSALQIAWAQATTYLATFKKNKEIARVLTEGEPDHIDFKVALFDARRLLVRKARRNRVVLPPDLGIDEAVDSAKDPRGLMLQLASVEKLARLLVALQIPRIKRIEPLPPEIHTLGEGPDVHMREYPIRLEIRCDYAALRKLITAVSEAEHFFAVRRLRAEKAELAEPDLLDVSAVFGALVFRKDLREIDLQKAPAAVNGNGR